MSLANAPCPCGSGLKYKKCCGRLHRGLLAEYALLLMKSRYSAYALSLVDYVMDTTHPLCSEYQFDRPAWRRELAAFCSRTQFAGLLIIEHALEGTEPTVTFQARLNQGGRDVSFCEKSWFERVDGRWLYRAGTVEPEP